MKIYIIYEAHELRDVYFKDVLGIFKSQSKAKDFQKALANKYQDSVFLIEERETFDD